AKLDGKPIAIDAFQDAFISVKIPSGTHHLELTYLPQGFVIGVILFLSCLLLFILFRYFYQRKVAAEIEHTPTDKPGR
ncbi:YfhO family protein, partial [Enterococcus faecalis]|uniref:YfhO family protein n=1 Tax=Enterococcus faecalis TaxID=1351 RepID=UPI003984D493